MLSRPDNRRCCTRTSWMRTCVFLLVALLLFMVTAFFGRLVIQRMVNSGVRALEASAELISGPAEARCTLAFSVQS